MMKDKRTVAFWALEDAKWHARGTRWTTYGTALRTIGTAILLVRMLSLLADADVGRWILELIAR